jgi:hypothetical protein
VEAPCSKTINAAEARRLFALAKRPWSKVRWHVSWAAFSALQASRNVKRDKAPKAFSGLLKYTLK